MNTKIKKIRETFGYTQEEFSKKLHLSRNFISQLESGTRKPSQRTISDIINLGINKDWLCGNDVECSMFTEDIQIDENADLIAKYADPNSAIGKAYIKLLRVYDQYPEEKRPIVNDFIEKLIEEFEKNKRNGSGFSRSVSCLLFFHYPSYNRIYSYQLM